jgi:outer membrane murein-binding lipoprotein Lpp
MRLIHRSAATPWLTAILTLAAGAPPCSADAADPELRAQVEELIRHNREMQQQIRELQQEVRGARDEARAASDRASRAERALPAAATPAEPGAAGDGALFSRQAGRVNLQLLDISLDALTAFGWSTEEGESLRNLQAGEHDPRKRGFNLQQVELGFRGAVDPFFTGDVFLVYFLDEEGESRFELEEAFATTQMLPFGLEEQGLQLEIGQFFTEYGRLNPQHPHAWDWQDQPVVNSRLFGGDGIRQTGLRVGWLTPLPWFSEIHLGVQNASGETMRSFLANDEVFAEGGIGGRPSGSTGVNDAGDLTYLARWTHGGDLGDEWSALWGVSGLFGPNATGDGAQTWIAGTDLVVKWVPIAADRGGPTLTWQSELSTRWYDAASFAGCPADVPEGECQDPFLPGQTLRDWGLYTQLLWGFRRGWAAGLRYEYATGSGDGVAFAVAPDGTQSWVPVSRNLDPFRDDRHRVSPLLVFMPSEFSRLRLQYNYDRAKHLPDDDAHTFWLGLEFLFGSHPAHAY